MNRKIQLKLFALIYLLGIVSIMSGCGYRLSGGGTLPAGAQSVCVTIFENRSNETGIDAQITNDMIYEFTKTGRKVVSDPAMSDAVVSGVVKSVSIETLSYKTGQISVENRVRVVVDVRMKNKKGEQIWSGDNIADDQAYLSDGENSVNSRNKKDALAKLSRRLAENIQSRMTVDF